MFSFIKSLFRQIFPERIEPPPGATKLSVMWRIIDWEYVPNRLAKHSSGFMYILAAKRTDDVPMLIMRRCHINRRTGQWKFVDVVRPSYRKVPDRIYNQMPDGIKITSPWYSGKSYQTWLRKNEQLIRECFAQDPEDRIPGIDPYQWISNPETCRIFARPGSLLW